MATNVKLPSDISEKHLRIQHVIKRLEAVLDFENSKISIDPDFDLLTSNTRKSRCLYEMNMVMRTLDVNAPPQGFELTMARVKKKLETNAARVKAHMDAVRDVANLIRDAERAAEDDGTYSMEQFQSYGAV